MLDVRVSYCIINLFYNGRVVGGLLQYGSCMALAVALLTHLLAELMLAELCESLDWAICHKHHKIMLITVFVVGHRITNNMKCQY